MAAAETTFERRNAESGEVQTVRPFVDFLAEHAEGGVHEELSQEFHALVERVLAIGKKGAVTLTVEVAPAGRGHTQVFVQATVNSKPPKVQPDQAVYFTDRDGNLTRRHPEQLEMTLPGVVRMGRRRRAAEDEDEQDA